MYGIQRQVTKDALRMFKRDRRREIDAVIDYFGESREAPASRSQAIPGVPSGYVPSSNRFGWVAANEAPGFPEG
jgi:hypothetical protein